MHNEERLCIQKREGVYQSQENLVLNFMEKEENLKNEREGFFFNSISQRKINKPSKIGGKENIKRTISKL